MILLISNSLDFATDFVVAQLLERGVPYQRLDLDLLRQDRVLLDPVRQSITIVCNKKTVTIQASDLSSILFRAPTHLRESSGACAEPDELLARHQWAAFARSLMLFEGSLWVNHPSATYRAENKPYQLMVAAKLGFHVPRSVVTNAAPPDDEQWLRDDHVAVKALDSFVVRVQPDEDAFLYTQRINRVDLNDDVLSSMPVIVQEYFDTKIDLRVTVVGHCCFAASVLVDGKGISGDWRLTKNKAQFELFALPDVIRSRCIALVRELGLVFGAIDLVKVGDVFYFLEINPTGEWAWLVTQCGMPIDRAIADELSK
jgi:glutathione synthase/RimK-type ligase-like ATP-grasp enzyme